MASTGENEQALQKIIDFIRLVSLVVMLFHFYFYCHQAFDLWNLTFQIADEILKSISNTGLFMDIYISKIYTLGLLAISLIGARGRKDEKINLRQALVLILSGLLTFLFSHYLFLLTISSTLLSGIYIGATS